LGKIQGDGNASLLAFAARAAGGTTRNERKRAFSFTNNFQNRLTNPPLKFIKLY
jgi:hypothetical protein